MKKSKAYSRYPISSIIIYNGATVAHFILGGLGVIYGYSFSWAGYLFGALYLGFAFVQMYVIMPLEVCPNCVYYSMENSICISGLNLFSTKIAKRGDIKNLSNRSKGILCHNNMYMFSLIAPIVAIIPALVVNFSNFVLAVIITLIGLLLVRMFVVFRRIGCIHCAAKKECPNAESMGLA